MKEVAAQLVTVVAPLMEFVQSLQRQRIAAAQRQQAVIAARAPMIRPAVVGAVPPLRCYNCNQPGHLAKDCPKPRTQSGPAGPTEPSQIPLAAPTAAGQGRVATVMDTGTTEMVTPAATEIGPDEYMAAAMFEPGTIGVIRHVQRITEESDLGPWRPGFEDLAAPGPEYKDGHIDVLDALKALDLRIPAISAVLTQQGTDGREHVIEYACKTPSQAQSNYEACKGECLGVVWGIEHFRPYLYGQKFVLCVRYRSEKTWVCPNCRTDQVPTEKRYLNARTADGFAPSARRAEVCTDLLLLRRLTGDSLTELTKAERRRVMERAHDYRWQGSTLQKRKIEDDGGLSWLTVPHRLARFERTRAAHEEDVVHFAVKYTKKAIEKNGWYWSGIREDVKYIVQNCPACAADKAPVQTPRTMVPTRVERPFQRVSIDTTDINVPRGPVDQGELNVLLVAVDHFSKWIEAYPMTCRNSQEVAWYINRFLCMHLDVEEVHIDNGSEFQGEVERHLLRADVRIIYSPGHWPQANGLVENANRLIKTALRRNITAGDTRPWPVIVDHILAVYRATPHGSTGVSPFQLRTNSVPRVQLSPLVGTEVRATQAHYMDLMARAYPPLARRRQRAVDRTHQRQIRDYENRHASAGPLPRYKVGDLMPVRKSAHSSKIHPRYTSIYEVTEVGARGQHFVKLVPRHNSQGRPLTRHAAALRPFRPSLDLVRPPILPESSSSSLSSAPSSLPPSPPSLRSASSASAEDLPSQDEPLPTGA
ncbi:hypothetical protein CBR_g49990 [Chara braunii]|uniref:Integrase catalytic domain-containing protein n=1 Tax=Chara braunii TaxID=69332 RepID=A0A388K564_CHABU|nr:hypothetical protein CBR_g49990 [Chara braunii]|eukprot:GBG65198.1 hypothetical protein CBR_g49990 [Chara braunii]